MKITKKKIYRIINSDDSSSIGKLYNIFMLTCIVLSLIPLAFKESNDLLWLIDKITVSVFIIDYALRWFTANIKLKNNSIISYLKYPFTPMAIVDLLTILPSLTLLNNGLKSLRMLRLGRVLRVFKMFRFLRYTKSIRVISKVIYRSREKLIIIVLFAIAYILGTALLVFNVEPATFNNFFEAVYWSTISLATIGYGDIYPVSDIGRFVAMVSAFVGVSIIALPASVLAAEFMNVSKTSKKKSSKKSSKKK